MTDSEVKVTYKAVADFSALYREALKAKAALRSMNEEQQRGDKASVSSAAALAAARKTAANAANEEATAVSAVARAKRAEVASSNALNTAVTGESRARANANKAAREAASASASLTRAKTTETRAVDESVNAVKKTVGAHNSATAALKRHSGASTEAGAAARRAGADMDSLGARAAAMGARVDKAVRQLMQVKDSEGVISGSLSRIGEGLSKLNITIPTGMVAGIAGLVSAVNPLVAGVSALGATAVGAASSLGTLASAAIGIVPALSAALGVASALKIAMSGVGGAITAGVRAAAAVPSSAAGGRSSNRRSTTASQTQSPFQLTNTEKITRAQQAYARSIQDVKFSEQNLFDARKQYTRQVQDLTEAVEQYTDATKAADAASVETAQQNYDNVLASSASTKADKDAARAAIQQAKEQQENDARQNDRNVQDLSELKKGGINNNQSVVQAGRGVVDAKNAERDAQLALENTKYNAAHPLKNNPAAAAAAGTTAAKTATDAFAAAMNKLSPAAQEFVRWFLKFRDAWLVVQKAVQQAFFEKFVGDLDRVYKVLPSIRSMLVDIAGALGLVVDKLLIKVTSASWARDFVTFGQEMKPLIADVGTIAGGVLEIFRNLTMAAMPFLQNVVHWLALGVTKFSDFIATGRSTGTIQTYLETVFTTLKKWWQIIKNVGDTLINYGIASSGFGNWLTDGLVKTTQAWDDASKKATDKNSPFRKYLESIKPVLTNIKGMIGDFFKWWAKVASDPKNIKTFNDVITIFRTQLGPAIGDILTTLAKSGLIKDLAQAITDIVKAIDALMKNGGIQGLKNLYSIVGHLAKAVLDFTNTGFGKWLMNTVVPPLVILAALSFAFGPLFMLFAWIARLAGTKGVLGLLLGLGKGIKGASAGRAAKGAEDGATIAKDTIEGGKVAKAAKSVPFAMKAGEGLGSVVRFLGSGIGAAIMGIATHGRMTTTGAIEGGVAAEGALKAAEGTTKSGGILGSILKYATGGAAKGAKGKAPKLTLGEELSGAIEDRAGGEGETFAKKYSKGISHLKDFHSVEGLAGKLFLGFSALDTFNQGKEALGGEAGDGKPVEYVATAQDRMKEALKEKDPKKRRALYRTAMGALALGSTQSIAGGAVQGAVNGSTIAAETLGPEAVPVGVIAGGIYGMLASGARDLGGVHGISADLKGLDPNKGKNLLGLGRDMKKAGGIAGYFGSQAAGMGDITSSLKKGGGGLGVGLINAVGDITGLWTPGGKSGGMAANVGTGGKNPITAVADAVSQAWNGMLKPWKPVAKNIGDWWQKHVVKPFQDTGKNIGDWWNNNVVKPIAKVGKQIGDTWSHNIAMPFKALIALLGRGWDAFVVQPFKKLITLLRLLWDALVVKPFQAVIKVIGDAWEKFVVQPFKKAIKVLGDAWDKHVVQPFKKAIQVLGEAWDKYVVTPFKKAIKAIQDAWDKHIVAPFKAAIKAIHDAWDKYVVATFKAAIKAIHDAWDKYVVATFKAAIKAIGDAWNRYVVTPFKAMAKSIGDWWNRDVVGTFKTVGTAIKTAWNNDVIRPLKGVAKTLTDAWNKWVIGPINKVTGGIATFVHNVTHMDIAQFITDKLNSLLPGGGGGSNATGKWAGTINQALQMAHAPASWGKAIATIIQNESSGDPNAINKTDSNWLAGHPSQGLMQTIPSTFYAYAGSLKNRSIDDPLANIYAGIRYIMSRYGSVNNVPGIKSLKNGGAYQGYSVGGVVHGQGSGDTVPAMLTPGEFVLTKKTVQRLGLSNLRSLNSGVTDMSQALTSLLQSQRGQAAQGMRNVMVNYGQGIYMRPITAPTSGIYNTFGDINIYNPAPEQATDSIPRMLRKVAYLKNGK